MAGIDTGREGGMRALLQSCYGHLKAKCMLERGG